MPTIVISRGSHSGGVKLAELLQQQLGWKLISQEMVAEAASGYGVSEHDIVRALDTPPSFWDRLTGNRERYILASRAALAQLLEDGNCIYHGLAGSFLLSGLPCLVRVRLIAPMEYRVRAVVEAKGVSEADAVRYIKAMDERRNRWVHHVFGVEWSDPSLYDLVINLETVRLEAATDLVVQLVQRPDYQPAPEQRRRFEDFRLAARVRAELACRSTFEAGKITVAVHEGIVHLSGDEYFERHRAEIVGFVKSLPGVRTVTRRWRKNRPCRGSWRGGWLPKTERLETSCCRLTITRPSTSGTRSATPSWLSPPPPCALPTATVSSRATSWSSTTRRS